MLVDLDTKTGPHTGTTISRLIMYSMHNYVSVEREHGDHTAQSRHIKRIVFISSPLSFDILRVWWVVTLFSSTTLVRIWRLRAYSSIAFAA